MAVDFAMPIKSEVPYNTFVAKLDPVEPSTTPSVSLPISPVSPPVPPASTTPPISDAKGAKACD